jgi:hypothetical protein
MNLMLVTRDRVVWQRTDAIYAEANEFRADDAGALTP